MVPRLLLACTGALLAACGGSAVEDTTIAAAASLRVVMPELVAAYQEAHPDARIVVSYGASGSLRQQVEGGAPIDAVVFASRQPVDDLVASGLVEPSTVRRVASNELVLIAPSESAARWTFATLHELPEAARVAIGDPGAVPAGRYTVEALTALGTWDLVASRAVFAGDVAMVLAYARRGEVEAAVVYRTDAASVNDVRVLDRAVGPWAPSPEIVAGRTALGVDDPHADGFLAFLGSAEAATSWRDAGFGTPDP